MRVICLVPSWTETLIEAGIDVVGRTRFCLHPADRVGSIPIVGGTKDISWEKVASLKADLLLLDREENPLSFAQDSPIRWHATHVVSVESMVTELFGLADLFASSRMREFAERGSRLAQETKSGSGILAKWGEWDQRDEVVYLIWKNPWMGVGSGTYLSSVLDHLGYRRAPMAGPEKYPKLTEEFLKDKVCLFSSEPYPFARKPEELRGFCPRGALVDGEKFSWFGIRGLRFLEGP